MSRLDEGYFCTECSEVLDPHVDEIMWATDSCPYCDSCADLVLENCDQCNELVHEEEMAFTYRYSNGSACKACVEKEINQLIMLAAELEGDET